MTKHAESLQQIMNRMASRLDAIVPAHGAAASVDPLSEVGHYLTVDPELARLHKDYLNAQRQYIRVLKSASPDAPMSEIVRDLTDSAYMAFEIRLCELRRRAVCEQRSWVRKAGEMPVPVSKAEISMPSRRQKKQSGDDLFLWVLFYFMYLRSWTATAAPPLAFRPRFNVSAA